MISKCKFISEREGMSMGMPKFDERFLLRCKDCGCEFYPWKTLMVTSEKTNWKEFLYCPNCSKFDDKTSFKIN